MGVPGRCIQGAGWTDLVEIYGEVRSKPEGEAQCRENAQNAGVTKLQTGRGVQSQVAGVAARTLPQCCGCGNSGGAAGGGSRERDGQILSRATKVCGLNLKARRNATEFISSMGVQSQVVGVAPRALPQSGGCRGDASRERD